MKIQHNERRKYENTVNERTECQKYSTMHEGIDTINAIK